MTIVEDLVAALPPEQLDLVIALLDDIDARVGVATALREKRENGGGFDESDIDLLLDSRDVVAKVHVPELDELIGAALGITFADFLVEVRAARAGATSR